MDTKNTKNLIIVTDSNNVPVRSVDGNVMCLVTDSRGDQKICSLTDSLSEKDLTANCSVGTKDDQEPGKLKYFNDTPVIPTSSAANDLNDSGIKKLDWTDGTTRYLLDLYADTFPQIGPMKKFRTRNHMWKFVASKLSEELDFPCNATQCDSRFKSVIRATNNSMKYNHTSGNDPKNVPWETEIRKIRSIDDSLQPRIMRGIGISVHANKKKLVEEIDEVKECNKKVKLENTDSKKKSNEKTQPEKNIKKKSIVDAFLQVAEERERNKTKRHEEKMQLLREALAGNRNN